MRVAEFRRGPAGQLEVAVVGPAPAVMGQDGQGRQGQKGNQKRAAGKGHQSLHRLQGETHRAS